MLYVCIYTFMKNLPSFDLNCQRQKKKCNNNLNKYVSLNKRITLNFSQSIKFKRLTQRKIRNGWQIRKGKKEIKK